eukprot:3309025-Amphidinium_carterae.1
MKEIELPEASLDGRPRCFVTLWLSAACRCRLSASHSDMEADGGVRRAYSRLVSDVTQRSSIVSRRCCSLLP